MHPRLGSAHLAAAVTAVLFAVWTWLTFGTDVLTGIDASSRTPTITPLSTTGQIMAALAVVTSPVVVYAILLALTVWAARRRLHNFAWAIGLSIPLGWGASQLVKVATHRARPATALPLITAEGWSYPSSHMTAVTIAAILAISALVVTRRSRAAILATTGGLIGVWWLVFANRWLLRAHWFSDLIAGGFLGGFVASTALALAGVRVLRLMALPQPSPGRTPRAAVVVNPAKVPDVGVFRRQVEGECSERGWEPPLWFITDPADSGWAATRAARSRRVDLVFVAGGDGTVRTACAAMVESPIPVAILPVGTGNLLARNLGVPLDLADALNLAFDGRVQSIDVVEVRADGGEPDFSVVMAGMGLDAQIMSETNADLKKVVGPAAYVMAALTTLNSPPFRAAVAVDGGEPVSRTPAMALIANVGSVQGQIALAPDAQPDDGLLDLVLASPERIGDWGAIATRVLTRSADHPGVERAQGRRVVIEASEPVPYQIDGDTLGDCRRLEASILPSAIQVMAP